MTTTETTEILPADAAVPTKPSLKSYLGDAVYADFDGYHIVLTTENGIEATNTIMLEPSVVAGLVGYAARLTQHPADKAKLAALLREREEAHERDRQAIAACAPVLELLPPEIIAKCSAFTVRSFDIDALTREETVTVLASLRAGKWRKELNPHTTEPTINYHGEVNGIRVRLWASATPGTCRVEEYEETIPAQPEQVVKRKKLVCSDHAEPAAAPAE